MRCHHAPYSERGSIERLASVGPQLIAAAQMLRFRCMLARVPLADDFELVYRCPDGRVIVRGAHVTTEAVGDA